MTREQAIDILWDYHHVNHTLQPADLIFVLGSNDVRVARYAACLFHRGLAPFILFSGGVGRLTAEWTVSEAELFAQIAMEEGVPQDKILIENKSTNTGENVQFSKRLLVEYDMPNPKSIIAIQKPYMERRTWATLQAQWNDKVEFTVSSPQLSFTEYCNEQLSQDMVVSMMVGDFQRILEYPKQGFSSPQPVSAEVLHAFRTLVEAGYTAHLLKDTPLPWQM